MVVATGDLTGHQLPPGHEVRTSRAPRGAVDAMLDNSGVIKVGNHDSLMDVLQVLATQPLPTGDNLGILTNSESMGRLLADAAESHGLAAGTVIGDVDMEGTRAAAEKNLGNRLAQLLEDETIDAVALCLQPSVTGHHHDLPHHLADRQRIRQAAGDVADRDPGHRCGAEPHRRRRTGAGGLRPAAGGAVFSSPARSVSALAKTARYQRWRSQGIGSSYIPEGLEGTRISRQADRLLSSTALRRRRCFGGAAHPAAVQGSAGPLRSQRVPLHRL